jgi:glycosyltransferase involved in cell wall biosynthesis
MSDATLAVRHALDASANKTEKPRVLFVTPVVPAHTGLGAAMRCAYALESLCSMAAVTVVLLRRETNATDQLTDRLLACVAGLHEVRPPPGWAPLRQRLPRAERSLGWLRRALHPNPLDLGDYPVEMADEIALGPEPAWHSMHVFRLRAAPFALRLADRVAIPKVRRVLDLDDIESKAMRRLADARRVELGRRMYWLECLEGAKTAKGEERLGREFGTVLVCSDSDRDEFQRRCPATRVAVMPNVYPLPEAAQRPQNPAPAIPTVLFVGSLDYHPNQDAVHLLLREIVPRVRADVPNAIFRVAGRRPPEWMVADCAAAQVDLIPNPPDMAPLYRDATVAVVPLLSGGGTRIKILEAFAHGVPVVSTAVGAEGLLVAHEANILLADAPSQFSRYVTELLRCPGYGAGLAAAGWETVGSLYSPPVITARLAEVHGFNRPRSCDVYATSCN